MLRNCVRCGESLNLDGPMCYLCSAKTKTELEVASEIVLILTKVLLDEGAPFDYDNALEHAITAIKEKYNVQENPHSNR